MSGRLLVRIQEEKNFFVNSSKKKRRSGLGLAEWSGPQLGRLV